MPERDTIRCVHTCSHIGLVMQVTCRVICYVLGSFSHFPCEAGADNFHVICVKVCGMGKCFFSVR